jgi:FKBP12-rapamycin complex-associated protein
MAILWHEMWHEALEEASRQYFGESNVEAMLSTLMPLHEMMANQGPTTLKEIAFVQVALPHSCSLLCLEGCMSFPGINE